MQSQTRVSENCFWIVLFFKVFSRMRSKGSRFTLGVWGLRVCSLDVAFVCATIRNCSLPMVSSAKGVTFACRVASFRVAGVALRDSDVFCNVSKVFLCGRSNTFATFSEDALQFSWQAQHFGRIHHHFAWQAQHFRRVVLRVFCESHCQGCVKWRQGANSVTGVAFCEMC